MPLQYTIIKKNYIMTSNSEKIGQLKKKLQEYYESRGIIPGEQFCCKNQDKCPGELSRGMQCHIGSRYGEKMRIVVASMDCGNGGILSKIEPEMSFLMQKVMREILI